MEPPDQNWIKLNTDGSHDQQKNNSGLGGVCEIIKANGLLVSQKA